VLAEDPDRHVADFALANPNFPKDYKGDLTGFALGAEDEDSWL
jgi:hypothetical protein